DIESYIPEVRKNIKTLEAWHQVTLFTSVIVPIVGLTVVVLAASFPIGVGVGALCGLPIALTKHLSTHITRTRDKLRELYNDLERSRQSERLGKMLNGVSGG
ncbi:MAG: hypothetical protein KDA30_15620, partial [Phycisphaerales bacterium]|nr:hypothetical protein [Phycisphaerales bacterium]